jgi:hypothetical protein
MFINSKTLSTLNLQNHKEKTNAKYAIDLISTISFKEGDVHPTTTSPRNTTKVGIFTLIAMC